MGRAKKAKDEDIIGVLIDPELDTITKMATELGISQPALSQRLIANPGLTEKAKEITLGFMKGRYASLYNWLYRRATGDVRTGDVSAARLILEALGDLKQTVKHEGGDVPIKNVIEIRRVEGKGKE
jgi:hypothetical protein